MTSRKFPTGPPKSKPPREVPVLTDVSLDQQQHGLETDVIIDRRTAARLGLTVSQIDNTPLRCLRPAAGINDLCREEPVPRRHGSGAGVLANPGNSEPDLCEHRRRPSQRHTSAPAPGR